MQYLQKISPHDLNYEWVQTYKIHPFRDLFQLDITKLGIKNSRYFWYTMGNSWEDFYEMDSDKWEDPYEMDSDKW